MLRQVWLKKSLLLRSLLLGGNAWCLFVLIFLSASRLVGQEIKSWSESQIDTTRFETEIERLEARIFDPPPGPIVFYGSSSFRLWKSLEQDFRSFEVLNCGFGGACLPDCVAFAPRLVLPLKPSAVVIYAGDNDRRWESRPSKHSIRSANSFIFCATVLTVLKSPSSLSSR